MNERSNGKRLLAICGTLVLLSGCASTLSKVTDKPFQESQAEPTIGTSVDDLKMETLIAANIKKAHPQLASAHVNVHSFNRVVLLTGEVPNEEMKTWLPTPPAPTAGRARFTTNSRCAPTPACWRAATTAGWRPR